MANLPLDIFLLFKAQFLEMNTEMPKITEGVVTFAGRL